MIYFEDGSLAKDLKELFKLGFRNYFFKETFFDEALTLSQCRSARRSFNDLFEIAKTYFPETNEKEVAKVLLENYDCFYCDNINKLVFVNEGSAMFHSRIKAIYDKHYIDGDEWSYSKLLKLLE